MGIVEHSILLNPFSDCEEIRPVDSFFIGAILVNCERVDTHGRIWRATFRQNKGQASAAQITDHRKAIETLCEAIDATVIDVEKRFDGFSVDVTLRKALTFSELLEIAESIVEGADKTLKSAMLAGAFDGKGSFDRAMGPDEGSAQFVMDAPSEYTYEVIDLFASAAGDFGITSSHNGSRQRKEGGNDRKVQFRISSKSTETFFTDIGLVSPFKLFRAQRKHPEYSYLVQKDPLKLPGVEVLSRKPERHHSKLNFNIKSNLRRFESVRDMAQEELIDCTGLSATERVPNEAPKEKGKLRKDTSYGKAGSYERDVNVAKKALAYSGFKCEIDPSHRTFIRAADSTPFTLPHHLIPMAYQDQFDYSIDIEENIVSLCSCCHDEIHHGLHRERLLKELYDERIDGLRRVGLGITFEELKGMYNL